MSLILYFLAFPGLPIIMAARWRLAAIRYEAFLQANSTLGRPTLDDVVEHGLLGTFIRSVTAGDDIDARARGGEFGPKGLALLEVERRRWTALVASPFVGLVLVVALSNLVPAISGAANSTTDRAALLILLATGWGAVAAFMLRTIAVILRRGRSPSVARAYIAGLVILVVAGAIVAIRLSA